MEDIRLTEYSKKSGCAAKMGPCHLREILSRLPEDKVPELLSSLRSGEDAGVYLLSEDVALVQTVDFFPPMVDDPRTFGRIAAANALSDVYAMGASPLTAMNIVAFPKKMVGEVLEAVLLGGHDKVSEAGAVVIGGHTIEDDEPKYGLAVTGVVKPEKMMTIAGARSGDVLLLTNALGTGIISTAIKAGMAPGVSAAAAIASMTELNRASSEVLLAGEVRACTDVTGFGLLGHLADILRASEVSAEITAAAVPLLPGAVELADLGMVPEGSYANREEMDVEIEGAIERGVLDCLYDPQTSGGLLASVRPGDAPVLIEEFKKLNIDAAPIGTVSGGRPGYIRVMGGV